MDRDVVDPRIEYDDFLSPSPCVVGGRFLDWKWEFYARWESWHFTLSTNPDIDPCVPDLRHTPPEEIPLGIFFRQGIVPDASYLSEEHARELVRQCIREFEAKR